MSSSSFIVDAVLFDMDGTLVDSIAAVEAAWSKVALDIGFVSCLFEFELITF